MSENTGDYMFSHNEVRALVGAGYEVKYNKGPGGAVVARVKHWRWSKWITPPPLDSAALLTYLNLLGQEAGLNPPPHFTEL